MLVRVRAGRFTFKLVARWESGAPRRYCPDLSALEAQCIASMLVALGKMVAAPALASGYSALQAGALLHELNSVLFELRKVVLPAGIAPASRGYRPRALLLS